MEILSICVGRYTKSRGIGSTKKGEWYRLIESINHPHHVHISHHILHFSSMNNESKEYLHILVIVRTISLREEDEGGRNQKRLTSSFSCAQLGHLRKKVVC